MKFDKKTGILQFTANVAFSNHLTTQQEYNGNKSYAVTVTLPNNEEGTKYLQEIKDTCKAYWCGHKKMKEYVGDGKSKASKAKIKKASEELSKALGKWKDNEEQDIPKDYFDGCYYANYSNFQNKPSLILDGKKVEKGYVSGEATIVVKLGVMISKKFNKLILQARLLLVSGKNQYEADLESLESEFLIDDVTESTENAIESSIEKDLVEAEEEEEKKPVKKTKVKKTAVPKVEVEETEEDAELLAAIGIE